MLRDVRKTQLMVQKSDDGIRRSMTAISGPGTPVRIETIVETE